MTFQDDITRILEDDRQIDWFYETLEVNTEEYHGMNLVYVTESKLYMSSPRFVHTPRYEVSSDIKEKDIKYIFEQEVDILSKLLANFQEYKVTKERGRLVLVKIRHNEDYRDIPKEFQKVIPERDGVVELTSSVIRKVQPVSDYADVNLLRNINPLVGVLRIECVSNDNLYNLFWGLNQKRNIAFDLTVSMGILNAYRSLVNIEKLAKRHDKYFESRIGSLDLMNEIIEFD
ncbi:MAG: hypothetical protein Q8Q35_01265 [Nanoarchaeota archaeon]|nr:hypothetical protein [Nanoarchaeota archaeon]